MSYMAPLGLFCFLYRKIIKRKWRFMAVHMDVKGGGLFSSVSSHESIKIFFGNRLQL
jgi:hypothetical protein